MNRTLAAFAAVSTLLASIASGQNIYTDTILVANDPSYKPLNFVDPLISNGWGVALRPPGAGGHFWVSNQGTGATTVYVGDVHTPTGFVPLFQDSLTKVDIPPGSGRRLTSGEPISPISQPTGQVYNHSTTDFVVSGEGVTGASKFIFVTAEGTISGWTETRDEHGTLNRQTASVITVDQSQQFDDDRLRYTGCAVTDYPSKNLLFVTNWTEERVEVYDHEWKRVELPAGRFTIPTNNEIWRPWNIQYFRTGPNNEGRLWVAYNKAEDPWEEYPDFGAAAEFDLEGNFIRRLTDSLDHNPVVNGELRDPWGFAIAPPNFGPLSNTMLVANFGDGTIPAFDLKTGHFVDFIRDQSGEPLVVDGIWGITFGNGVGLGDTDALYYAAGPNAEADGSFGTVRWTPSTCPVIQQQPISVTHCPFSTVATLNVIAPSPVRCEYRWQIETGPGEWADLADGPHEGVGHISGSASLTLSIASPDADARFRCIITNQCGSVTSEPAMLGIAFNGDANFDTVIDFADITAVLANFCNTGPAYSHGDADGDGSVTFADIASVLGNFGASCS